MNMRSRFTDINRRLVAARQELRERERLLNEIARADAHKVAIKRDVARYREQGMRQQEQLESARNSNASNRNWLSEVRQLRTARQQTESIIERLTSEIQFIERRISEYEERLVDVVESEDMLEQLREEQLKLLSDWASGRPNWLSRWRLDAFQELLATIADAQAHIVELGEAIVFGDKAATALSRLLEQVWHVWHAPNDYRLGREIETIGQLAQSAEARLNWFNRELWDVDHHFNDERTIPRRIVFCDQTHRDADAKPAPRVDPQPIETLMREVSAKLKALRLEQTETVKLIDQLNHKRAQKVDELWNASLF